MLEKLTPLYNDHLRQMATETSVMLMKSIESFAEKDEKKAQWVYFSLDQSLIDTHPFLKEILDNELEPVAIFRADLDRWKRYREMGGDCLHDVNLEGE